MDVFALGKPVVCVLTFRCFRGAYAVSQNGIYCLGIIRLVMVYHGGHTVL